MFPNQLLDSIHLNLSAPFKSFEAMIQACDAHTTWAMRMAILSGTWSCSSGKISGQGCEVSQVGIFGSSTPLWQSRQDYWLHDFEWGLVCKALQVLLISWTRRIGLLKADHRPEFPTISIMFSCVLSHPIFPPFLEGDWHRFVAARQKLVTGVIIGEQGVNPNGPDDWGCVANGSWVTRIGLVWNIALSFFVAILWSSRPDLLS